MQLVIGPARSPTPVEPLREPGNAILAAEGNIGPVKELGRLGRNLGAGRRRGRQLRGGIAEASDGAGLLAQGSDRAAEGAQLIANGPRPRRRAAASGRSARSDQFAKAPNAWPKRRNGRRSARCS